MKFIRNLIPAVTAVLLCACNIPQAAAPTATAVPTVISATATPLPTVTLAPAITAEQLQNATYQTPQYHKSVTLTNGKYEGGSGADYFMASLLPQQATGDLNGDGLADAVVLLAENGGGSGVFVSVVGMLNQSGQIVQSGTALIDDRPVIHSVEIKDGKILLSAVIHGINDPMVSPTLGVNETYQLMGQTMMLVRFASKAGDSSERSILIDSPADGTQVSASVQVKGSMPVGPFENTLAYRILDDSGKQLVQSAFMVKSDGAGGLATFDNAIDLTGIAAGSKIRLELVDESMANGATIALDSVGLVVK